VTLARPAGDLLAAPHGQGNEDRRRALIDRRSLDQVALEQLPEAAVEPLLRERLVELRVDHLGVHMLAVVGIDGTRHRSE